MKKNDHNKTTALIAALPGTRGTHRIRGVSILWLCSIAMVVVSVGAVGAGRGMAATTTTGTAAVNPIFGQYYLAMGDSLPFGTQLPQLAIMVGQTIFSNPPHNFYDPSQFNTGYDSDLSAAMQSQGAVPETNLSCPEETTGTFFGTCPYPGHLSSASPLITNPLHVPMSSWQGSQWKTALTWLGHHSRQKGTITFQLGGNDVDTLRTNCMNQSNNSQTALMQCVQTNLPQVLATMKFNLEWQLFGIHLIAPASKILVLGYYNPYAADEQYGDGVWTDGAFIALNQTIAQVASDQHLLYVDPFPTFNRPQPPATEQANLCILTATCLPPFPEPLGRDVHPTNFGYQSIADLAYLKLTHSRFTP